MNEQEIRQNIIGALRNIAPESDPAALADSAPIREALDLDSMDFLSFVTLLHDALHVDVPEADYGRIQTIGDAVQYLSGKLRAPAMAGGRAV